VKRREIKNVFFILTRWWLNFYTKRLILTLKNLILVFLAWLYLYYKNLKKCSLKRFLVFCTNKRNWISNLELSFLTK
jgi:hypothetical protein